MEDLVHSTVLLTRLIQAIKINKILSQWTSKDALKTETLS